MNLKTCRVKLSTLDNLHSRLHSLQINHVAHYGQRPLEYIIGNMASSPEDTLFLEARPVALSFLCFI